MKLKYFIILTINRRLFTQKFVKYIIMTMKVFKLL